MAVQGAAMSKMAGARCLAENRIAMSVIPDYSNDLSLTPHSGGWLQGICGWQWYIGFEGTRTHERLPQASKDYWRAVEV
jgi:hypothetical protein